MGGATARFLARAGVRVVGIADRDGLLHNPDGLDVETLLLSRDQFGVMDRSTLRPGDVELPREQWLALEAEVLVPAAMSYVITTDDVEHIRASIIVEAANLRAAAAFIAEKLSTIEAVQATATHFRLKTYKENGAFHTFESAPERLSVSP